MSNIKTWLLHSHVVGRQTTDWSSVQVRHSFIHLFIHHSLTRNQKASMSHVVQSQAPRCC